MHAIVLWEESDELVNELIKRRERDREPYLIKHKASELRERLCE
tara:strand:+ start:328 stop:459 length:132 start_codon:yes stop_codon:yes gene_type:complete